MIPPSFSRDAEYEGQLISLLEQKKKYTQEIHCPPEVFSAKNPSVITIKVSSVIEILSQVRSWNNLDQNYQPRTLLRQHFTSIGWSNLKRVHFNPRFTIIAIWQSDDQLDYRGLDVR